MRIVSLVPSWTETLCAAGLNVVGRTRFCIHPKNLDAQIVGGTKNWDIEKIRMLRPDFLILDEEENPKWMAEQNEFPWIASRIRSVHDLPLELDRLGIKLESSWLRNHAKEWRNLLVRFPRPTWQWTDQALPGLMEWGRTPSGPVTHIVYLIWKNPWMGVSRDTFAGSVLEACGLHVEKNSEKYPVLNLDQFDRDQTLILFSSEPYPFLTQRQALHDLGFPYAFVDGESFTWFGVRSFRFLSSLRSSENF